jgi:biopolymer transport protein ExbD
MRYRGPGNVVRFLVFDLTPMIDVVFLLIIFFMTTARFAEETRAELDLPQERGEQQEVTEEAGMIVNVRADGTIVVDTDELTPDELTEAVRAEIDRLHGRSGQQLKLMIRADRNADTAHLNRMVEQLQAAGVGAARLATEVP